MQRRGTIICLTYKDKSLLLPEEGGLVLPHVKLRCETEGVNSSSIAANPENVHMYVVTRYDHLLV